MTINVDLEGFEYIEKLCKECKFKENINIAFGFRLYVEVFNNK